MPAEARKKPMPCQRCGQPNPAQSRGCDRAICLKCGKLASERHRAARESAKRLRRLERSGVSQLKRRKGVLPCP